MAIEKMTGISALNQMNPSGAKIGGASPLDKIARATPSVKGGTANQPEAPSGIDFKKALEQAGLAQSPQGPIGDKPVTNATALLAPQALKFSNHAIERMHSRGISFSADEMKGIENAVSKAAQKGFKRHACFDRRQRLNRER